MKTEDITRKHNEICRPVREREERKTDLVLILSFTAWWLFFTVSLILVGEA